MGGKFSTLAGSSLVNGTPPAHFFVGKKETGAIFAVAKGIAPVKETAPDFTVRYRKVPGNAIDIIVVKKQHRSGQPITAIARTKIAVGACC